MSAPLVVEHFDVVEQLHLGLTATLEAVGQFAVHAREEAFHDGVVVTIAATAHAAGDPVRFEHRLVVLTRGRAALVGVMQQAGVETLSLQRHLQRFDRHVAIVDGAQGSADDKPREEIENDREVELAAAADTNSVVSPIPADSDRVLIPGAGLVASNLGADDEPR